jgi:Domain of unknown function (DUF4190)
MSDTSQGPGWWLASDGKWYPPELWTGPPGSGPQQGQPAGPTDPGAGEGQGVPPYPDSAGPPPGGVPGPAGTVAGTTYGSAPGAYPGTPGEPQYPQYPQVPQYPSGGYGGPPAVAKTNGLAVASLVCSCVGVILFTLPCILGVIFGFVARSQIRRSQGAQKGDGLALAGIIVGFAGIVLLIILVAVSVSRSNSSVISGTLTPTAAVFGL